MYNIIVFVNVFKETKNNVHKISKKKKGADIVF